MLVTHIGCGVVRGCVCSILQHCMQRQFQNAELIASVGYVRKTDILDWENDAEDGTARKEETWKA